MDGEARPAARARVQGWRPRPGGADGACVPWDLARNFSKRPPASVRDTVTTLESESGTNFVPFPGPS